tara:strand:+ start:440 stop:544 length:105 start_codon:yes stop_codon:yes gene_type:complete
VPIIIIGNKIDLENKKRNVDCQMVYEDWVDPGFV